MMNKSAAWEAGFIAGVEDMSEMEKEAFIRNLAGAARRGLGRTAMGVAGGIERAASAAGKSLGSGRLGSLADRAAISAGQSARASARAVDSSALAAARRKAMKANKANRLAAATTPEARQAIRGRNARAQQLMQQRAQRRAAPTPTPTPTPAPTPAATRNTNLGLLGAGLAVGAGGTYLATRPQQSQYGGQA